MKAKKGTYRYYTNEQKETVNSALQFVVEWSEYPESRIRGIDREESLVDARHWWWMLCMRTKMFTIVSLGAIVEKDHGTIIHAMRRHQNRLDTMKYYRDAWSSMCGLYDEQTEKRRRTDAPKNTNCMV